MPLLGYPSRWSVRAGERLEFMVSADVASYEAEIIRITGRGPRPDDSPPLSYVRAPSDVDGTYRGAVHQTVSGSYGTCHQVSPSAAGEGSLVAWVYPTLPALGRWQSILTWLAQDGQRALGLGLDGDGYLALSYRHADGGAGLLRGPGPLEAGRAGTTPPPAPVRPAVSWPCCAGSAPALTWGPRSSSVPRTSMPRRSGPAHTSPRSEQDRSSPAL